VSGVRRIARWVRLVLGALFLLGIIVQFLLAGYGWFVPRANFDAHADLGFTAMHLIPILILIAGLVVWRPFDELGLGVAIGVLGFIQPILAGIGDWAGVFHPLNALVLFVLTYRLADRDRRTLRRPELPAAGETRTEPAALS
jgi:hypothetical protein